MTVLPTGYKGIDGDGDVFNPDNISVFSKFVMDHTHNLGVHFMMADGVSRAWYLCYSILNIKIWRRHKPISCCEHWGSYCSSLLLNLLITNVAVFNLHCMYEIKNECVSEFMSVREWGQAFSVSKIHNVDHCLKSYWNILLNNLLYVHFGLFVYCFVVQSSDQFCIHMTLQTLGYCI